MRLVLALLMLVSRGFGQQASAPETYSASALSSRLAGDTKLPLRLPTSLEGASLFVVVKQASASRYEIVLATALPCAGQHTCTQATLEGSTSRLAPLTGKGTLVRLRRGIMGRFLRTECGAYCGEAYVRWREEHVFYSIGIKAGKKGELIRAANSAIPDE
jgi:hypothetical protein